jgi:hypothetical protein
MSAKDTCLADMRGFEVFDEAGIIVGALIFASDAGKMRAKAALAVRLKLKIEDVYHTIHVHPLTESFLEAAIYLTENKYPMHISNAQKMNSALVSYRTQ